MIESKEILERRSELHRKYMPKIGRILPISTTDATRMLGDYEELLGECFVSLSVLEGEVKSVRRELAECKSSEYTPKRVEAPDSGYVVFLLDGGYVKVDPATKLIQDPDGGLAVYSEGGTQTAGLLPGTWTYWIGGDHKPNPEGEK